MNKKIWLQIKNENGQGMTEYIIIVALIAIAAIGVVTLFGDNIRDLFGASGSALSGADAERQIEEHVNKGKHKELDDFQENTEWSALSD